MSDQEGPDRIFPCENLTTSEKDGCVKIRKTKDWPANRDTMSLPTFFRKQCESAADQKALSVKRDGKWVNWTYKQYYDDVITVSKAFITLGLERYNSVCIYGFNCPEWFFSYLAAIHAGGKASGLYPTNSAEANKFIMNDCECNILVVEDEKALEKIWNSRNELKDLKKIVVIDNKFDKDKYSSDEVLTWNQVMEIGKKELRDGLDKRLADLYINECCVLVYTSGTTGNPKGVMLSHDNIYWTALTAADYIQMREGMEVMVSYLPLSHIAGSLVDIWSILVNKGTTIFADKMALRGSLLDTLREARPTIFFGVPRVWEKIMEGMLAKGKDVKGLKKKISVACKKAGLDFHLHNKQSLMYTMGQKVVYKKVREALGFDRCVAFFGGAAPLSMECLKYFCSLDIIVLELYGMSETTGPHTINFFNNWKIGTVGPLLSGCKNRLADPDEKGEGEVCMWGRHVMMGYLNRPDKTSEDVDEEGWMHSGDLGSMDSSGFLSITGRKKELIITAGGENVAPVPIEDHIKAQLPCISNAILIGDKQKFLSVFLTFKVVMDNDSPTNQLSPTAIDWCKDLGRDNITTVDDILSGPDKKVMAAIQMGIDKANKHAVSNAARVQRWTILPTDVSIPGGELGPTLKLKRFYFCKKYNDAIERLYEV